MFEKPTYEELERRIQELEKTEYKRKQADLELERRLEFIRIVLEISSELSMIGSGGINQAIDRALSSIGVFTKADHVCLFHFKHENMMMDDTSEWCSEGVEPLIENLKNILVDEELPWFAEQIRRRDIFHVPDVAALPSEAQLEREHLEARNIQSIIIVPMETKDKLIGYLGFDSVRECRTWSDNDKSLLRLFSQTLSHVIERKRIDDALREVNSILNRSSVIAFTWKNQEGWPVEFVSENVEKLFGYTAKEFLSGEVSYADCVHKDDIERVGDEVKFFSDEKGRLEYSHEPYRIVTKDDNIKVVSDWTFINRDQSGSITHYKGIIEDITERKQAEQEREQFIAEFNDAISEVRTLSGLLPICSLCKKIRDDNGYWNQIEDYIKEHTEIEFSHSICQECSDKLYGDQVWYQRRIES
jgi:PAS domain S-box-containing protein